MKYYIIAGEASGDLHGANLIKALIAQDSQANIRFWGGDKMQEAGGQLVKHYRELAFMGFWEVVTNLSTILKNIRFCKIDIAQFAPDALIFIDYPGFNMRIARWAKQQGYSTHYYISPQIWAWKEGRIKAIKRDIDNMLVILPFEKNFYEQKHHFPVEFVGHPLLDELHERVKPQRETFLQKHGLDTRPIVALLPGSRKQEIQKMLTIMLSVVPYFPQYQFVIAGAPSQNFSLYAPLLNPYKVQNVHFVSGQTYELLSLSQAALVTSGTATLETALIGTPEVVCYKGSEISYQIAKRIINLEFISLVNLIMNRKVVTELIQNELNTQNLKTELSAILEGEKRTQMLQNYALLQQKLGQSGASERAAKAIIAKIKN